MSVVIPGKDKPYGVLGAHSTRSRHFTANDTRFLQSIANILASAIERSQSQINLQTSRDELSVILGGITEGVVARNASGEIIYANDAAFNILATRISKNFST
jgi:GAF domain-containing protein